MPAPIPYLLVAVLGIALAACASGGTAALAPPATATDHTEAKPAANPAPSSPGLQPDGTYVLSEAELALNCKKLTGRAMVRLFQIRDYELSSKSSFASRQFQKVTTPVFGGTARGADPDADYRLDRAMIEAYNRRLQEKGCKSFDLVKELQPKPAAESPALAKR